MHEISRLIFEPEEERLWCIVPEARDPTSSAWYAYVGVGNPQGRLIKVDLLSMQRIGYVDLAGQDIRTGIVVDEHAYFVTSTKPATVLRCPTKVAPSQSPYSPPIPCCRAFHIPALASPPAVCTAHGLAGRPRGGCGGRRCSTATRSSRWR